MFACEQKGLFSNAKLDLEEKKQLIPLFQIDGKHAVNDWKRCGLLIHLKT